jgi:ketosteroid isomerase-like protein
MRLAGALVAAIVLIPVTLTAQGPAAPAIDPALAAARRQIDSVNALYIKAFGDADVDEVVALYDTAATELLAHGVGHHGHAELRKYWSGFIRQYGALELKLQMVDLWLVGDKAYETGRYTSIIPNAAGKHDVYPGNYATVWQRQRDGGWKILAVFDTPR